MKRLLIVLLLCVQPKRNHFCSLLWGNGEEQQGTKLYLETKKELRRDHNHRYINVYQAF